MMTPDLFSSRHTSMTSSNEAFLNSSSGKSNFDRFIAAVREAFERLSVYMGLSKGSVPFQAEITSLRDPGLSSAEEEIVEVVGRADAVEEAVTQARTGNPYDKEL